MSDSGQQYSSAYSFVPGQASNQDSVPSNLGPRQRLPNIRIIDEVRPNSAPVSRQVPCTASSPPASADAKFTCRICLDTPSQPVVTVCGHLFCWNCLYQWIDRNKAAPQCPVCRAGIEVPDCNPERARVIPLYVDTSTDGKDPRTTVPPRPQAERPESHQPARSHNFLHDLFGFGPGGGVGHNVSFGLGVFPGLFLNLNLGNGGVGVGHQSNSQTSGTMAFMNRLVYSIAFFLLFIVFMM